MRFVALRMGIGLCSLSLFLAACDATPGLPTAEGTPPVLSDLAFTPDRLDVAALDEGQTAEIPFELEVTARDPDGAASLQVSYVVRSPLPGSEPLQTGTLQAAGGEGGRYRASTTLRLSVAEVGVYTLRVLAVDEDGLISNQAIGSFLLTAGGRPPTIEEVIAPERIQRPSEGSTTLTLAAVVSDPDGFANLSSVVFWNVNNPANTFALRDDGQEGDETAGDGRYTATVQIASTNPPGETTLVFQARDRSGLESDPVEKTITVE